MAKFSSLNIKCIRLNGLIVQEKVPSSWRGFPASHSTPEIRKICSHAIPNQRRIYMKKRSICSASLPTLRPLHNKGAGRSNLGLGCLIKSHLCAKTFFQRLGDAALPVPWLVGVWLDAQMFYPEMRNIVPTETCSV